jgi:hypothetical protein
MVLVTCYCSLVYAPIGRFLSFARTRQTTTGHSGLDTCTLYRVALCCVSDQHLSHLETPTRLQPANRTPRTVLLHVQNTRTGLLGSRKGRHQDCCPLSCDVVQFSTHVPRFHDPCHSLTPNYIYAEEYCRFIYRWICK